MKRKTNLILLSSALIFTTLGANLVSCNKGNDPIDKKEISVESVSLTSNVSYLNVGKTLQLNTKISPSDATNQEVTYSSTDDNIATISNTGLVTAIKEGDVTLKVITKDGNKESSLSLKIIKENYSYATNANELGEALYDSPYQSKVATSDKFGVKDQDKIGVNIDEASEVYYGSKADDSYDKVIDVTKLTLEEIKSVISSATEINNLNSIQAAIYLAKKYGDEGKTTKIKLPKGKVDIDTTSVTTTRAFILDGLKNVTIEGNDTIINIKINELNYKGYLTITNCTNLSLYNIRFTQEVPANVTGSIESFDLDNRKIEVKINKEFNETIKRVIKNNKKLRSYLEFHKVTKTPIQNGNLVVDGFKSIEFKEVNDQYTATITFTNSIVESQLGTLATLQFAQYDVSGIAIDNSENVYVDSITMNHAYGMGLTCGYVNNFFLNKYNQVIEENTSNLITSCADALHFSMMKGEVKVTNSIIEYSHDDALNIKHGYYYKVDDCDTLNKVFTFSRITTSMNLPKEGDKIQIYEEESFEGHGTYTVVSAKEESGKMLVTVKERIRNYNTWNASRVTFIYDTPMLTFKNNIIRNKRNRGILVQVPNAIIENNTFQNVGHGSIQAGTAMDKFNEATLPQDITIRNNKFISNNYLTGGTLYGDVSIFAIAKNGAVAPNGTIKGATIENNYFYNNGNSAISLRGVGDSTIKDNLFYDVSSSQPNGEAYNCIFSLSNTSDVTISGNYNQYNLTKGLSGIIPQGTTSKDSINLIDNKSIEFQVIDDVGPEVDITKATGNITIDGNIDEWSNIGATDIEIRGYTDALGNEWTKAQLDPTFEVKKLMMTWDDTGIYIGFDIFDDKLDCRTINDFWMGDCVEVLASTITNMPTADLQVYKEEGGVIQTAFAPTWTSTNYNTIAKVRSNSKYVDNKDLLECKLVKTSNGYSGEIKYPFTMVPEFKESIDNNKRINMAIIVGDAERDSRKRIQASNVAHNVENNKTSTARMPQYLFK